MARYSPAVCIEAASFVAQRWPLFLVRPGSAPGSIGQYRVALPAEVAPLTTHKRRSYNVSALEGFLRTLRGRCVVARSIAPAKSQQEAPHDGRSRFTGSPHNGRLPWMKILHLRVPYVAARYLFAAVRGEHSHVGHAQWDSQ